ncbi:uncharacterized protein LOC125475090 [Pyrus x bretschneideri]|uniref:uncharacterized protein LOC125475090 n=1 Tax=Pyrus x bretschneideri TaxID=225117 RepID=UPI00202EA4D5|nr:uncharacterized protein LOC125475090 [Pyrus x bretschneideri]
MLFLATPQGQLYLPALLLSRLPRLRWTLFLQPSLRLGLWSIRPSYQLQLRSRPLRLPWGKRPHPTVILEEDDESDESDEIPLECRPRPANSPPVHPPFVVEAAVQPDPPTADRGKRPLTDPEATAETPLHPQDEDLPIPPQEVSSAFPSWEVELDALLQSMTGVAGSSIAPAEPVELCPRPKLL